MDRYLTIVQVAESLGVAARTVRGWKSKGKIPVTILPGGDVRFNEKEIARWLEGRTIRKKKPDENKVTGERVHGVDVSRDNANQKIA